MTAARQQPLNIVLVGWLNDLYLATIGGNQPIPDIKARVAVLAVGLMNEFSDPTLFGKETLLALSRQNRFFPPLADLVEQLHGWQDAHRPRLFTVPIELEQADMPGEARAMAINWLRRSADGSRTERELTIDLAIIRRYGPAGYHWLINARSDAGMMAADIAVRQRWTEVEHRRTPATEAEMDAVAEIVHGVGHTMHAGGTAADVRADDGVVKVERGSDPPVVALSKPPGTLSPEQLRIVREQQNPALAAIVYAEPPVESAEVVSLGDMREKKRAVEPPPLPWEMDSAAC